VQTEKLENEKSACQRQVWKLKKKVASLEKQNAFDNKDQKKVKKGKVPSRNTPRSRANAVLRKAGMSPRTN